VTATSQAQSARCTLCPALCSLGLVWAGPDQPRVEVPPQPGEGVCPRGTMLGELLTSPKRLRWPRRRQDGSLVDMDLSQAVRLAAERLPRAGQGGSGAEAVVLIDGALPLEEIAAAAEIVAAWEGVRLCCVVAPEDEQVLLGVEASGAAYLSEEDLASCDGFVIVGDVFAANPRCSRGVLDAVKSNPRTPIVTIDSGGGIASGFATLAVPCPAGQEQDVLDGAEVSAAVQNCRKLGVLLVAEAGRGDAWMRLGYQAGKLANAHGGGVAVQTAGANALGALRLSRQMGLMSLAEAMRPAGGAELRVALGVDVLGLLGWSGPAIPIAAAALPNATTAGAEIILPTALPCELDGTVLQAGTRRVGCAALLAPPAGVPTPAELLRSLASAAGVSPPERSGRVPSLDRLNVAEPPEVSAAAPSGLALVGSRDAAHHAEGSLTGQASWQQLRPLPELRICPADAKELGVGDLERVEVQTESHRAAAQVRVLPRLARGTVSISEGFPEVRRLMPYLIDAERNVVVSHPAPVQVIRPRPGGRAGRNEALAAGR